MRFEETLEQQGYAFLLTRPGNMRIGETETVTILESKHVGGAGALPCTWEKPFAWGLADS